MCCKSIALKTNLHKTWDVVRAAKYGERENRGMKTNPVDCKVIACDSLVMYFKSPKYYFCIACCMFCILHVLDTVVVTAFTGRWYGHRHDRSSTFKLTLHCTGIVGRGCLLLVQASCNPSAFEVFSRQLVFFPQCHGLLLCGVLLQRVKAEIPWFLGQLWRNADGAI